MQPRGEPRRGTRSSSPARSACPSGCWDRRSRRARASSASAAVGDGVEVEREARRRDARDDAAGRGARPRVEAVGQLRHDDRRARRRRRPARSTAISACAPCAGVTHSAGTAEPARRAPSRKSANSALRVERGVEDLGGGRVEHARAAARSGPRSSAAARARRGRARSLERIPARARVVAHEAAQRRPREGVPVDHAPPALAARASSACTASTTASAPVCSSGAWLTPPASLRTNSIALGHARRPRGSARRGRRPTAARRARRRAPRPRARARHAAPGSSRSASVAPARLDHDGAVGGDGGLGRGRSGRRRRARRGARSSGARRSAKSRQRSGIVFVAPGATVSLPIVATAPGSDAGDVVRSDDEARGGPERVASGAPSAPCPRGRAGP